MRSRNIVIVGILLGIGAIVRYVSLIAPGPITSNLVIAFYALAIVLVAPTALEALGIGIVSGIICALISHSLFPPANLISEPVGAMIAFATVFIIDSMTGARKKIANGKAVSTDGGKSLVTRKDNVVGFILGAIGVIVLIVFALVDFIDAKNAFGISFLQSANNQIITGAVGVVLLLIGLYLIPVTLNRFKAAIVALLATLASGLTFITVAAIVIFEAPGILNGAAPPINVFILAALPIVIGCAFINMILAQVLYFPAKQAMR